MSRTNRQILINLHTSGTTAPAGKLNLGEIAVQHNSVEDAALWIETDANSTSEDTLVKFINASAVATLIESASTELSDRIDAINDAVGLPHSAGTFSADTVWDAIEQVYEELIASAAAATTYVVPGDSEDTEKYLKITDALDETTSARTYTISLSGISDDIEAVDAKVNELSGVVEDLSTFVEDLDYTGVSIEKKPVVNVEQENGLVSAEQGSINAEFVDVVDADDHFTAATKNVENVLAEIAEKIEANEISNTDGSINVTTAATGTVIDVNIKSGEKVLAKDGNAGLYTDIKLSSVTPTSTTVKEEFALYATDGSVLGDHIKIYKDSHIVSITYISDPSDAHYQNLVYKYIDADGAEQTEYVDVSSLVLEAEFASGVGITNHVAHGVVDPATEKDSNNDAFLTVGADGFKVDGIKNEIDTKIAALDVTDTAEAGKYVSEVNETDGRVSMTRANVSDAVLNGYSKGEKPASTAIAATDDVKGAIAKLEHQIDDAKAAATTKVVEGTDAGNNMTITPTTSTTDGSVTYTIDLTDVASKAALDAEIAARKAVDGQDGQTYAANTGATYISDANDLNDADVKLDAALKSLADRVSGLDYTDTVVAGQYVTKVDETDGLISVARANVSEAVLNGYVKGTDASEVTSSDSINQAVSKLENQIDAAETALTAEIAARKAVDGQDGQTYAANTGTTYISDAANLNDADVKLDSAIAALAGSAVTEAGFAAVAEKETNPVGSNAGINVVDAENGDGKKVVLDLSLLKIDCGEY